MTPRLRWARHAPAACVGGLVIGLAMSTVMPGPGHWLLVVSAACLLAAAAAGQRGRAAVAFSALVCGCLGVGLGWGLVRNAQTAVEPLRGSATVSAALRIETFATRVGDRRRVRAALDEPIRVGPRHLAAGSRVFIDLPDDVRAPRPGEIAEVAGRIGRSDSASSPGWWRRYLTRQRVVATLSANRIAVVGRRGGVWGLRDRVRVALTEAAGRGLDADRAALVRGMALGGGSGLSDQTAKAMRRAGIWHLLAVSGQNVAFVAMGIGWLLSTCGMGRRGRSAVSVVSIVAYCLCCDGGASVARAGIVGGLAIAADGLHRASDRVHLTLVGLALLLAIQPRSIADPGLQLSFAAVTGLMGIAPTLRVWLRGVLPGPLATYAAMSVAASIATAPVTIMVFGTTSLVGVLVNVVVAPLAGPVVVAALVGAVAGSLRDPLGVLPTEVAGWGAQIISVIAHVAAATPGSARDLPAPFAVTYLALCVAIPAVGWWLWSSTSRTRRLVPPGAALVVALLVGPPAWILIGHERIEPWPQSSTLSVLDIGQGDAILLRSPDGAAALVDTGPPGADGDDPVVRRLRRAGVRRLDVLMVTHDQRDHSGAASAVTDAVDVRQVAAPAAMGVAEVVAAQLDREVVSLEAGDRVRLGQWRLQVLWPPADARADDPNDVALVLLVRSPGLTALLTSDAEGPILNRLPIPRVDVLKVSHHGSADDGLPELLGRIRPGVGVISAGADNRFGHPTEQTISALESGGVMVRRTDTAGTVSVFAHSSGVRVMSDR